MDRLVAFISKNITGKKVLIWFILANIVYVLMLTVTIPKVMSFSEGMRLFDMMPMGYSPEYALSLLETLGDQGRDSYLYHQIPLDMIYPLLFAIAYSLVLGYFLKKLKLLKKPYAYLCLLPIIAGLADYLENFGIISLLKSYPDFLATTVKITNYFTLIKSATTTTFFVVLIVLLVMWGISRLRTKIE